MTTDTSFAQKLAKDAVEGLLKQAGKQAALQVEGQPAVTIDPETQKKLIDREIKMAVDPDYEMAEIAKEKAVDRMRNSMNRGSGRGTAVEAPPAPPAPPPVDKSAMNAEIGKNAKAMLDLGVPPAVVAQVMMGSLTPNFPIAFTGGGNQGQGLTLTDVMTLVDRMNANKGDSELHNIIKEMREEIKALRNAPRVERAAAPPESPASQIEGLTKLVEGLVTLGVVQRVGAGAAPAAAAPTGKTLDVVKEENRHNEAMETLKIERKHKEDLVEIAGSIPERIGRGIGSQMMETGGTSGPAKKSVLQSFTCECGEKIIVTPETGDRITCAHCKAIYGPKKTAGETAAKAVEAPAASEGGAA